MVDPVDVALAVGPGLASSAGGVVEELHAVARKDARVNEAKAARKSGRRAEGLRREVFILPIKHEVRQPAHENERLGAEWRASRSRWGDGRWRR